MDLRNKHYPALDGLRGIAALMIVAHHSAFSYWLTSTFDKAWLRATSLLWVGVDLFFVLSGFLITNILLETRSSPSYFRTFYGRRILRIFPLYYGFLAVVYFIVPLLGGELSQSIHESEPWLWTYTTNIYASLIGHMPDHSISQAWTLAIEEQFYLLWPLLLLYITPRHLWKFVLALFLAMPLVRALSLAAGETPFFVCTITYCRLDGLALGALLSILMHNGLLERLQLPKWRRALKGLDWIIGMLVLAFILIFCFVLRNDQFRFDVLLWPPWLQAFGLSIITIPLGYGIFRCVTPDSNWLQRAMNNRQLRWMGKYSYALYVLHAPVVYWAGMHLPVPAFIAALPAKWSFVQSIYIIITQFALSIIVAVLSWHILEKHFLKLKKYLLYRPAQHKTELNETVTLEAA